MTSRKVPEDEAGEGATLAGITRKPEEVVVATFIEGNTREAEQLDTEADLARLQQGVQDGSVKDVRLHTSDNGFVDVSDQ